MPWILLGLGLSLVYFRGWHQLRAGSRAFFPLWRGLCFPFGLFLIWMATSSPLAMLDQAFLTAHMVQHLLLMTIAPFLILSSRPKMPLLQAAPAGFVRFVLGTVHRTRFVRHILAVWGRPVLCWIVSIGVLVVWHVPFIFHAALKYEFWHVIEHISFLAAGFLFWSPLFPSQSSQLTSTWSLVLYLFLATLPCDILSGFLVFSDRVVYSVYLMGRHISAQSALDDQQCAGALMWTIVTILYLLPAAALTVRLLGAKHATSGGMIRSGPN